MPICLLPADPLELTACLPRRAPLARAPVLLPMHASLRNGPTSMQRPVSMRARNRASVWAANALWQLGPSARDLCYSLPGRLPAGHPQPSRFYKRGRRSEPQSWVRCNFQAAEKHLQCITVGSGRTNLGPAAPPQGFVAIALGCTFSRRGRAAPASREVRRQPRHRCG